MSRRDFLKLLGVGALGGVLGKFVNFESLTQTPAIQSASAQSLGSWTLGANLSIPAIHSILLRNGKIMYVAGSGYQHSYVLSESYKAGVFDPSTNSEIISDVPDDLFCCGFSQLADGNILIAGGTEDYDFQTDDGKWHGGNYAYEFDVESGNFYKLPSMRHGRWYPSMGTLPDGKVYVQTGFDEFGVINALTEIYDPTYKTFNIKYDPTTSLTYCVGAGSILPGAGTPCYGGPNQGVNYTTFIYARTIIMPSGLVFYGGQRKDINTWDPVTGKFTRAGLMTADGRGYGNAILLPLNNTASERGRVLLAGGQELLGAKNVLNSAEIIDFNAGTNTNPVVVPVAPLTYTRMYALPIILPTGEVILFGGTSSPNVNFVYRPEMFDPNTNTWTILPPATVGRQYHSVALLLPDGRVWTASGTPDVHTWEPRTEIYSPWYFFAGARPTISGEPVVGTYGETITIPTPDASDITSVSLLRLSNTTHHFDFEHRLVWLQIQSTTSSSVTVSAPINANIAPPGYYQIHVLNSSGVPSIGKIIKIAHATVGGSDTTPPKVSIQSPSSNLVISGPSSGVPIQIQGTAFDSQSGVQSVLVSIDSGVGDYAIPRNANDWSSWSFFATILTKGPHTIKATAIDNSGNKSSIKVPISISF